MEKLNQLIQYALQSGADRAVIVSAGEIVIDAALADKCREPRCPNYGLAKSCPPHVAGPAALKEQLTTFHQAILFKIEVPSEILFTSQRREVFQQLHKAASGLERAALQAGFSRAQGYAGGSCREIFCHEHADCPALSENGECRHPQYARPSMSGFGIDVAGLFETAGWALRLAANHRSDSAAAETADICGLVLIY